MVTKEEIIEAIASIVQYNGLDAPLKVWRRELDRQREGSFSLHDLELNNDLSLVNGINLEIYDIAQEHFIYMLLVLLYGNYGTSPRFGWIDDTEGAAAFLDDLLKSSIIYLD